MALTTDIVASYRRPGAVVRRRSAGRPREDRALITLMLACALIFLAQWPRLSREAFLGGEQIEALLAGAIFGWLFIVPLFMYGLAAVTHLAARLMGGQGTWYGARVALFWALLAASPLWLLWGLVAGFIGAGPALNVTGIAALGAFLAIWLLGLRAVEKGEADI